MVMLAGVSGKLLAGFHETVLHLTVCWKEKH